MLGRKTRTLRDAYPEGDPYLAPVTYPYTSTFPSVPIPLPPMQARGGPTQAGLDAVARGIGGVEIGGDTEAPQEQPQTGNRAITSQRPDQSYPRKIIYEISNFGLLTSLVLATIGDLTTKLNNCLVQTTMLFLSGFFFMVSPKFGKTKGLPYFSSPMPIVGIIYITFSLLAFFLNAIPLAWDYDTNFDSVSDKSKATTKCINDTVVVTDGLNHSRILDAFNGVLCLTVIAVPLITLIVIKTIYAWEEKKKNEGTEKKLKETETENQKLKAELGELQRRMQTLEEAAQSRFNPFADSRSQLPQPLRSSASPKTGEWRRVEPTGTSKGQWQRVSEQSKKEEKEESKEEDTASDRSLPPPPPPLYSRTVRVPAKLAKTKPDHIIPLPPLSPPLSPPRVVTADARP